MQPGMFWLALFYLAPLFTLLRTSLSTLPSRFAVEAEFDWNFGNYADALTDFGAQFQRGFVYAGGSDAPVPRHRLPAGVRHRLPRWAVEEPACSGSSSCRSSRRT